MLVAADDEACLPAAPLRSDVEAGGPVVLVAGFWRRLLAASADIVCLAPVFALVGWLAVRVGGIEAPARAPIGPEMLLELLLEGGVAVHGGLALVLLLVLLYEFLFMVTTGATPGQRLLGLRLINVYGAPPESWRVLLRCLWLIASLVVLGLGLLWIGFDRKKRGLHDLLAGTYVIRDVR